METRLKIRLKINWCVSDAHAGWSMGLSLIMYSRMHNSISYMTLLRSKWCDNVWGKWNLVLIIYRYYNRWGIINSVVWPWPSFENKPRHVDREFWVKFILSISTYNMASAEYKIFVWVYIILCWVERQLNDVRTNSTSIQNINKTCG